ncbi:PIH1 domain-containing protein 1-like [Dendronephthya gigantea]|uniref:PIH1 domain-containing protein 1-like n=1 Tax=Dendronephthya gigantea TaxID=151771 RepID=UPI00106C567B|nr:PIH1 domain-containing protein 1-like [Dendronephthya gigantea]
MEVDTEYIENEEFYKNLLLSLEKDGHNTAPTTNDNGKFILPKAGFVIKTKNEKNEKIFMNILSSEELPSPKDITETELQKLLEDPDATQFKIPLALGDPHAETDKSGKGCTVYDVVINDAFLSKLRTNNFFMGFFMTVVYEGIESKYNTTLSRDWVMLKNKKCIGDINKHRIRNRSKPVIQEMDQLGDLGLNEVSSRPLAPPSAKIESDAACEPSYRILQEPPTSSPEYLILEVSLPGVKSMNGTVLDVGDDRLILDVPGKKYHLDLTFDHLVDYESGGAQFNRKTKTLTVTIPVLKES